MRGRTGGWRAMAGATGVFLLSAFFYAHSRQGAAANLFRLLNAVSYGGLIFVWWYSLKRRIVQTEIRFFLMGCCALMLLWLVERTAKYDLFPLNEGVKRQLWYGYYLPVIFAPLLGFLAALRLGEAGGGSGHRRWNLLFMPGALLASGILTNDLHQCAFRFRPGLVNWNADYEHCWLYYLTIAWTVVLLLASIALMARRCRVEKSRRLAWVPLAVFMLGFTATEVMFFGNWKLFEVPEMMCFTFVMTWEACIQIGILPSNRDYEAFFRHSGLAARIVDGQGAVRWRSQKNGLAADQEQIRVSSAAITGGRIEWEDDLSALHRLNAQLEEVRERLSEQAELTRAENEMKEERARTEEKQLLYDRISCFARPHLEKIRAGLNAMDASAPDFAGKLTQICVQGAYVKRRSNLMLLAWKSACLPAEELAYSLRESLEYLNLRVKRGELTAQGTGLMKSGQMLLCYDFFEAALETLMAEDGLLSVRLQCDEAGFSLRMVTEKPYPVEESWRERLRAENGDWERAEQDDVCYTTLRFAKGAAA